MRYYSLSLVALAALRSDGTGETPAVVVSASVQGFIENCGCSGDNTGGLVKGGNLIDSVLALRRGSLVVDAGDFSPDTLDTLKLRHLRDAMDVLGFTAGVPGERDAEPLLPPLSPRTPLVVGGGVRVYGAWAERQIDSLPKRFPKRSVLVSHLGLSLDSVVALSRAPSVIVEGHAGDTSLSFVVGKARVVSPRSKLRSVVVVTPSGDGLNVELLDVSPDAEDNPCVLDVLSLYNDALVRHLKSKPPRAFRGPGYCKFCHGGEYRTWETSKHAHALETLKARSDDPSCLTCHTTGYARGGYGSDQAGLGAVTCESCHETPRDHPTSLPPQVGEAACKTCHTRDRSPAFDFKKYFERIAH